MKRISRFLGSEGKPFVGSVTDLNLTISKPSTDNFISGTILDPSGNAVEDAIVYAWSDDGRKPMWKLMKMEHILCWF